MNPRFGSSNVGAFRRRRPSGRQAAGGWVVIDRWRRLHSQRGVQGWRIESLIVCACPLACGMQQACSVQQPVNTRGFKPSVAAIPEGVMGAKYHGTHCDPRPPRLCSPLIASSPRCCLPPPLCRSPRGRDGCQVRRHPLGPSRPRAAPLAARPPLPPLLPAHLRGARGHERRGGLRRHLHLFQG